MIDLETRVSAALDAAAEHIDVDVDRLWQRHDTRDKRADAAFRRRAAVLRWAAPLTTFAAVLAVLLPLMANGSEGRHQARPAAPMLHELPPLPPWADGTAADAEPIPAAASSILRFSDRTTAVDQRTDYTSYLYYAANPTRLCAVHTSATTPSNAVTPAPMTLSGISCDGPSALGPEGLVQEEGNALYGAAPPSAASISVTHAASTTTAETVSEDGMPQPLFSVELPSGSPVTWEFRDADGKVVGTGHYPRTWTGGRPNHFVNGELVLPPRTSDLASFTMPARPVTDPVGSSRRFDIYYASGTSEICSLEFVVGADGSRHETSREVSAFPASAPASSLGQWLPSDVTSDLQRTQFWGLMPQGARQAFTTVNRAPTRLSVQFPDGIPAGVYAGSLPIEPFTSFVGSGQPHRPKAKLSVLYLLDANGEVVVAQPWAVRELTSHADDAPSG